VRVDLAGVSARSAETSRGMRDTMWTREHGGRKSKAKSQRPHFSRKERARNGAPGDVKVGAELSPQVSLSGDSPNANAVPTGGTGRVRADTGQPVSNISSAVAGAADFYPVLTEEYATQIARGWNTKDERSGFVGHVLRFHVQTEYLRKYDVQIVGSLGHREYWIPRNELHELNANIVGEIEIVSEFQGS
jgi:hypothetical protein